MTPGLVLSLFPGIGLLDRGFEAEGYCVVRGPDLIWGGDIRLFRPPAGVFEGVIGGPPCQPFSSLAHLVRAQGYTIRAENLIPEFERCVAEAAPRWFVMENVRGAPIPKVFGYETRAALLDNRWLGEEQSRLRRISFGTPEGAELGFRMAALEHPNYETAVCASGSDGNRFPVRSGGRGKVKSSLSKRGFKRPFSRMCELQGLPEDFDLPGMTASAKVRAIGNGVPVPMAREIARAVRAATETLDRGDRVAIDQSPHPAPQASPTSPASGRGEGRPR